MKPGQLYPNELELAILEELAREEPALISHLEELHVLSRKYTGVGCYTEFLPIKLLSLASGDKQIWLDSMIVVPEVKMVWERFCSANTAIQCALKYIHMVTITGMGFTVAFQFKNA